MLNQSRCSRLKSGHQEWKKFLKECVRRKASRLAKWRCWSRSSASLDRCDTAWTTWLKDMVLKKFIPYKYGCLVRDLDRGRVDQAVLFESVYPHHAVDLAEEQKLDLCPHDRLLYVGGKYPGTIATVLDNDDPPTPATSNLTPKSNSSSHINPWLCGL